jgi:hypothetical protein
VISVGGMSGVRWLFAVASLGLLVACNSDGDGPVGPFLPTDDAVAGAGGNDAGGSGAGGEPSPSEDLCGDGCVATLAAECEHGPGDQVSCEADCRELRAGTCGAEYAALQSCAKDETVSCSADGYPIVAACADQQAAFVACVN